MTFLLNSYTAGSAPPPTDPYFSSTVLLLSCDGSNGSTTFTDQSFAARGSATVVNDAQVTTAVKKFGSGSLRLDGTLDLISFADSTDWSFGNSAFTVEGWFSFDPAASGVQVLVGHYNTNSDNRSWRLSYNTTTDTLNFTISANGLATATPASASWVPTADTFYHIAVDRSGDTFRLYIDGAMVGTGTNSSTLFNAATVLRLGASAVLGGTADHHHGNQDEVRITKGVARYASDSGYVVPTAAFPRS